MKRLKLVAVFLLTVALLLLFAEVIEIVFAVILVATIGTGMVGG